MNPLGTQHIAEFLKCKKDFLNDEKTISEILLKGIELSGLHHVKIISHRFQPLGVTVLAIISESHIGLHTYPEAGHISLDIFTCSEPTKQLRLLKYLRKVFTPKKVRIAEIQRGNPIEFKERNWIASKSEYGFEVRYHIKKKVYSKKSKYQMIDVIDNDHYGKMLFLDKDLQIAERDADIYNEALVNPIKKAKRRINNALILGGGDGGILYELLKLNPSNVTLVDIDEKVIKVSKKYLTEICHGAFDDPRVDIIACDAIMYIEKELKFDAIIYDLTMHPEAFARVKRSQFLDNLFKRIKERLNKNGIVTYQVGSEFDNSTLKLVKKLTSKYFESQKYNTVFIPSFAENWIFGSARPK